MPDSHVKSLEQAQRAEETEERHRRGDDLDGEGSTWISARRSTMDLTVFDQELVLYLSSMGLETYSAMLDAKDIKAQQLRTMSDNELANLGLDWADYLAIRRGMDKSRQEDEEDKSYFPPNISTGPAGPKAPLYATGTLMRIRPDVKKPAQGWGKLSKKSVGVVVQVFDNKHAQINFPEESGRVFPLDEVEEDEESDGVTVGAYVTFSSRVKQRRGTKKWFIPKQSIGRVKAVDGSGNTKVFFGLVTGTWKGTVAELTLAPEIDVDPEALEGDDEEDEGEGRGAREEANADVRTSAGAGEIPEGSSGSADPSHSTNPGGAADEQLPEGASGEITFRTGDLVEITGLQAEKYNGAMAVVQPRSAATAADRVQVQLLRTDETLSLRPERLTKRQVEDCLHVENPKGGLEAGDAVLLGGLENERYNGKLGVVRVTPVGNETVRVQVQLLVSGEVLSVKREHLRITSSNPPQGSEPNGSAQRRRHTIGNMFRSKIISWAGSSSRPSTGEQAGPETVPVATDEETDSPAESKTGSDGDGDAAGPGQPIQVQGEIDVQTQATSTGESEDAQIEIEALRAENRRLQATIEQQAREIQELRSELAAR